jgi:hypothetical protein
MPTALRPSMAMAGLAALAISIAAPVKTARRDVREINLARRSLITVSH